MYWWTKLATIRRIGKASTSILYPRPSLLYMSTEPPDLLSMRSSVSPGNMEKLIGYPTPLLSLRHLLGGELAGLSLHLKRLLSSKHPIVEQTRLFIDSHTKATHTQGMLSLLTAKSLNDINNNNNNNNIDQFGILPSQRTIAEVTEMIHIAHMIHSEVVDIKERKQEHNHDDDDDLLFGNKMIILGGDVLLARACKELSLLYVPKVVGLMSEGISVLMEESYSSNSSTNTSSGSLLGKSCQCCAVLGGMDHHWSELSLELGNHLSIIHQFSQFKFNRIHVNDELRYHHSKLALNLLEEFPDSQSRTALEDFIVNNNDNNN